MERLKKPRWTGAAWYGLAVALLTLPAVADAVIVAGPYWEVQGTTDGTWSARTGASHGPADWNQKGIVRSWSLPSSFSTYLTIRTNTTCLTCGGAPPPPVSDYWVPGNGPLALNSYPHPMNSNAAGVNWVYTIGNGADQLTVTQKIEQGGSTSDRSYVHYSARICNDSPAATKVGMRLLVDIISDVYAGPQPQGQKAWISAPPGPSFTQGSFNRLPEVLNPVTPLGYVYQRLDVGPLTYIGLLNNDASLGWLPTTVSTPDRFAYWRPTFGSWEVTGAWPDAGEEVVSYWWGYDSWIDLAAASMPGRCVDTHTYWVPLAAVFPPVPPTPDLDFDYSYGMIGCAGQPMTFTSGGVGTFTGHTWDFGDLSPTGSGNPIDHTYTASGDYTVTHTAYIGATQYQKQHFVRVDAGSPCPPAISELTFTALDAGSELVLCPTGEARRGGELTWHLGSLPKGAVFDATTNCLTWTPEPGQEDVYCFWFRLAETTTTPMIVLTTDACQVVRVRHAPTAFVPDSDQDGKADDSDICPQVPDPDQLDSDHNGMGDACQPPIPIFPEAESGARIQRVSDRDRDGIADSGDNCADVANFDQSDYDGDAGGDACDLDVDGDGVRNTADNCAARGNRDQLDLDQDGQGDVCDVNPGVADAASSAGSPVGGAAAGHEADQPFSAAKVARMGFGALAFAVVLGAVLLLASRRS